LADAAYKFVSPHLIRHWNHSQLGNQASPPSTPTLFQTQQDCLMCCALRQFPVTDFMSDHPFRAMCDRGSASPHQRREDTFPLRTTLPSREPSKEDIELAQRLIGHSQAARNNEQTAKDSPSPTYELQSQGSKSPSSDRMHQFTRRSLSVERSQRETSQSYLSATSPPPHTVPSGQICR
jgi:hypothetical protein